jgi:hypothetical protein
LRAEILRTSAALWLAWGCSGAEKVSTPPVWGGVADSGVSDSGSASSDDTEAPEDTGVEEVFTCWDFNLGSSTGRPVTRGATLGQSDDWKSDFAVACGSSNGPDIAYLWRAPSSGCFRFDTEGFYTDYDATLSLFDPRIHGVCDGDGTTGGIACDDDEGEGLNPLVEHEMIEGAPVLIILDGYSEAHAGEFELNIQTCAEAAR